MREDEGGRGRMRVEKLTWEWLVLGSLSLQLNCWLHDRSLQRLQSMKINLSLENNVDSGHCETLLKHL